MALANGEVIKLKVLVISQNPNQGKSSPALPENNVADCCFCLPVFGDTGNSDPLRNDFNGFLKGLSGVSNITFTLQKNEGSGFTDLAVMTGSTYGTDYPFGFLTIDNKNYAGYTLEWRKVLSLHGTGTYRIKTEVTPLFGSPSSAFSFTYDLKNYAEIDIDGTVRLEFYLNHLIGDWENPANILDFGTLDWADQIRLPNSIFGREKSDYEREEVRFTNGVLRNVQDDQKPLFELEIDGLPSDVHRFFKTQVLQSDDIYLTDYNSTNPNGTFTDFNVKHEGDYSPNWNGDLQTPGVYVNFVLKQNNLRKKLC